MMPVDDVSKNLSFSGSRYRAHRQHWRTVLTVARELAFTLRGPDRLVTRSFSRRPGARPWNGSPAGMRMR